MMLLPIYGSAPFRRCRWAIHDGRDDRISALFNLVSYEYVLSRISEVDAVAHKSLVDLEVDFLLDIHISVEIRGKHDINYFEPETPVVVTREVCSVKSDTILFFDNFLKSIGKSTQFF